MDLTVLSMVDCGLTFPPTIILPFVHLSEHFFSSQTCHDYKIFLDKTALGFDD